MSTVIGDTLPLAVAVAISPVPIIALVLILLSLRARSNGPAYLLGWLVGLVVAMTIAVTLVSLANRTPGTGGMTVASLLRLAIGVLLLFLGIRQWRNRPKAGEESRAPRWMTSIDSFSPAQAFGLAVLLSSIGNIALVLAAGVAIGRAKLSVGQEIGAGAIFVVLSSLLVLIVVIFHFLAHERATKILQSWKVWLLANIVTITGVAFVVIGTLLVGKGIGGLDLFG